MVRTKKTKDLCVGCRNNFYNGNNSYGIAECWSYKSARIARKKFVPIDLRPPWKLPVITTLSCHWKQRFVAVGPTVMR